jgi:hypothetical protein
MTRIEKELFTRANFRVVKDFLVYNFIQKSAIERDDLNLQIDHDDDVSEREQK